MCGFMCIQCDTHIHTYTHTHTDGDITDMQATITALVEASSQANTLQSPLVEHFTCQCRHLTCQCQVTRTLDVCMYTPMPSN